MNSLNEPGYVYLSNEEAVVIAKYDANSNTIRQNRMLKACLKIYFWQMASSKHGRGRDSSGKPTAGGAVRKREDLERIARMPPKERGKKLHSANNGATFKQSVDYRYNIRGWMSSMNNSSLVNDGGATNDDTNDLFGMNLLYNQTDAGLGNAVQYNGNISAIKWNNFLGQASVKERGYIFSYDALNRLLAANHRERTAAWVASSSFHENGLGYDLNGNITTLARKGAAGLNMDQLTYTYSGNRLQTVVDAGDITKGFADGNVGSTDYTYDVKGNMTVDKNKGITAITYNHLNLPVQVTRNTGEYARFSYDAGGVKLCESFYNSANVLTKQLDYVGDYFYQNDSLKQISHTDGRVMMTSTTPEYQYTLKDHLGNARVTFTAKMETDAATGTYEPTNATAEQSKFVRYEYAKRINSTLFDRTNGAATGYSQRLNGSANEKYGLARSISVMPGDVINAEVYAKYVDPVTSNWNTVLTTLMSNIASSAAGVVIDGANYTTSTSSFPASYPGLVTKTDNGAPKAYLNWLIFDRNYTFLNGGFQQISAACRETGTDVAHDRLASPTITITQPGYVYIYVSNDNPTQTEVFFDDLSVSQTKSPIVSTDDYMPFGLTFNSFQRESSFANRWKFQEQERITEMGLNWDSFKWRNHQPEIGRFFNIDPLTEKYYYNSPYAFSENRVINGRELEGLEVVLINEKADPEIYRGGSSNKDNSAVHIYAHGTPSYMDVSGNGNWSDSPKDFQSTLEKSEVYKNRKEGDNVTVVIHSCRTGRSFTDEKGRYNASFAEKMSAAFPDLTIIAPDERDAFSSDGREMGPRKIDDPKNLRGDYKDGAEHSVNQEIGNWNVFEGGKLQGFYDGNDYDGRVAPSWILRTFFFNASGDSTPKDGTNQSTAEKTKK